MYVAYLDEFGHIGPFVSKEDQAECPTYKVFHDLFAERLAMTQRRSGVRTRKIPNAEGIDSV